MSLPGFNQTYADGAGNVHRDFEILGLKLADEIATQADAPRPFTVPAALTPTQGLGDGAPKLERPQSSDSATSAHSRVHQTPLVPPSSLCPGAESTEQPLTPVQLSEDSGQPIARLPPGESVSPQQATGTVAAPQVPAQDGGAVVRVVTPTSGRYSTGPSDGVAAEPQVPGADTIASARLPLPQSSFVAPRGKEDALAAMPQVPGGEGAHPACALPLPGTREDASTAMPQWPGSEGTVPPRARPVPGTRADASNNVPQLLPGIEGADPPHALARPGSFQSSGGAADGSALQLQPVSSSTGTQSALHPEAREPGPSTDDEMHDNDALSSGAPTSSENSRAIAKRLPKRREGRGSPQDADGGAAALPVFHEAVPQRQGQPHAPSRLPGPPARVQVAAVEQPTHTAPPSAATSSALPGAAGTLPASPAQSGQAELASLATGQLKDHSACNLPSALEFSGAGAALSDSGRDDTWAKSSGWMSDTLGEDAFTLGLPGLPQEADAFSSDLRDNETFRKAQHPLVTPTWEQHAPASPQSVPPHADQLQHSEVRQATEAVPSEGTDPLLPSEYAVVWDTDDDLTMSQHLSSNRSVADMLQTLRSICAPTGEETALAGTVRSVLISRGSRRSLGCD